MALPYKFFYYFYLPHFPFPIYSGARRFNSMINFKPNGKVNSWLEVFYYVRNVGMFCYKSLNGKKHTSR